MKFNIKLQKAIIQMVIEEELEEGKPLNKILEDLIKGKDKQEEIRKEAKENFNKEYDDKAIDFRRVIAKIEIINLISILKVFRVDENRRKELSDYIVSIGEELKTIKGEIQE